MPPTITWQTDDSLVLGDATFKIIPANWQRDRIAMEGADFLIFKPRQLVELYVETIARLKPQRIFELGILQGGSTAMLLGLARPGRLVAIDRMRVKGPGQRLEQHASRAGFEDVVRIHGEVDQADRRRLAEVVARDFGTEPLDLVVDDCSHLYEPTKASFNELFPRLRHGGLYVIEDWTWAHTPLGAEPLDGMWPEQVPLTRLLFELLLAIPSMPGLISEISIEHHATLVRRGDAAVDPHGFELSACLNPRARELLPPL
jgi:SAM-dependent methyltransferase